MTRASVAGEKASIPTTQGDNQKTNALSGGGEKPDLRQMKAEVALECDDSSKLTERGIRTLTHSVTDESSRPISEVGDDPHFDQTEVCSENCFHGIPAPTKEEGRNIMHGSPKVDGFEGADGEIDSVSGGESPRPHSDEQRGRILSPIRTFRGVNEELENEDGEVSQAPQELPGEQRPTEMKLHLLSGQQYSPQSDSEEFSQIQNSSEEKTTDSTLSEVDDDASNLGTLSGEPRTQDEEFAQQTRLDSEISLFYPQQLYPEDIINPFSLEVRIRKSREQQDISLEWEAEAETIGEVKAAISQPPVNLEDTSRSFLHPKDTSSDDHTGSSERAVENGFHSKLKERIRTGSVPGDVDHAKELSENKPGVGEAVLLGALASGVNRPTWFVVRAVQVALVASLLLLLHVAIKSDSWVVLLNVLFLIFIAVVLILLLGWYVSQIGLVSVDKQMAELNLTSEPQKVESKTL